MTEATIKQLQSIGASVSTAVIVSFAMVQWTNLRIDREIDTIEKMATRELEMVSARIESLERRFERWPVADE